jgi:hypothetical protein
MARLEILEAKFGPDYVFNNIQQEEQGTGKTEDTRRD